MSMFDTIILHKDLMKKFESLSKVKGFDNFQTKDLDSVMDDLLTDDKDGKYKLFRLDLPSKEDPHYKRFVRTYTKEDEIKSKKSKFAFLHKKEGKKYLSQEAYMIKNRKKILMDFSRSIEVYEFSENDKSLHTFKLTFKKGILKDIEYLGAQW